MPAGKILRALVFYGISITFRISRFNREMIRFSSREM